MYRVRAILLMSTLLIIGLMTSLELQPAAKVLTDERPGIECGCTDTGSYVMPTSVDMALTKDTESPSGKYKLDYDKVDEHHYRVTITQAGHEILNSIYTASYWGFSPNDDAFVIHGMSDDQHYLWLYNLNPKPEELYEKALEIWENSGMWVESSRIRFSPHGRYLLYAAKTNTGGLFLRVINTLDGNFHYQGDNSSIYGSLSGSGVAGWGFSSDIWDATYVYAYLVSETQYDLQAINLSTKDEVYRRQDILGDVEWRISPCGDVFAMIDIDDDSIFLYKTLEGGSELGSAPAKNMLDIKAETDQHIVYYADGTTRAVTPNTAQNTCPGPLDNDNDGVADGQDNCPNLFNPEQGDGDGDEVGDICDNCPTKPNPKQIDSDDNGVGDACEPPKWPVGSSLTTSDVRETSLTLYWTEAEYVTSYQVYSDTVLLDTLESNELSYQVTGLSPCTGYEFKVEACHDEFCSMDGPSAYSWMPDETPPVWSPESSLTATSVDSTGLSLSWNEAQDNCWVEDYWLYMVNDNELELVATGAWPEYRLSCLTPNTTFTFKVEAVDGVGNRSEDGPSVTVTTARGVSSCQHQLERVSLNSQGEQTIGAGIDPLGGADSENPVISADGRYVAFESLAVNLVPDDTNTYKLIEYPDGSYTQLWAADIFVRDLESGITKRVSISSAGEEAELLSGNREPAISGDGRFVVFSSSASNLVEGDRNEKRDIFVHDQVISETLRVNLSIDGIEGDDNSNMPAISADGRYVAFASAASNLVISDTNETSDIFIYELLTGEIERVSVSSDGVQGNGYSWGPALSADGRYIVFASEADNLIHGDENRFSDVFIHDRQSGKTDLVSVSSLGEQGNSYSAKRITSSWTIYRHKPAVSADGRYIAFDSKASNLVLDDTNACIDVFVHDQETGETALVSGINSGEDGELCLARQPSISADGRYVAFSSSPSINTFEGAYVYDRLRNQTELVSCCKCGGDVIEANYASGQVVISADGRYVAFASFASNLLPNLGDTNEADDIFIFDREYQQVVRVFLPLTLMDTELD